MAQFTRQMMGRRVRRLFPTYESCKAYLAARRWPDGVKCPRCGSREKFSHLKALLFHWQCGSCSHTVYRLSVLVGTVFENTNVGLRNWFKVVHIMLTGKKGVAALEVQQVLGFGSYETAHYMCHRVRAALADPEFRALMGIAEADETYVGGKNKKRHAANRMEGSGVANKVPVIGEVSRNGTLVARALNQVNQGVVEAFIPEAVFEKVDLVAADKSGLRARLHRKGLKHESVSHSLGEYVRGSVHTQTTKDSGRF